MKSIFLSASLIFVLIMSSCGPAAEDRQTMHSRAKVFQDSIANMIRVSMAEAEAPGNVVVSQPTPVPVPTNTAK